MKDLIIAILVILVVIVLTGCGLVNKFCDNNEDTFGMACRDVVGYNYEQKRQIDSNTEDLMKLSEQMIMLEQNLELSYSLGQNITNVLQQTSENVYALLLRLNKLEQDAEQNMSKIAALQIEVSGLSGQLKISGIYNPCGDAVNVVDEILIKLSNNNYIVYFESGGGRRLSEIGQGNYKTTDGSNCYFSINSNGDIINEHY